MRFSKNHRRDGALHSPSHIGGTRRVWWTSLQWNQLVRLAVEFARQSTSDLPKCQNRWRCKSNTDVRRQIRIDDTFLDRQQFIFSFLYVIGVP